MAPFSQLRDQLCRVQTCFDPLGKLDFLLGVEERKFLYCGQVVAKQVLRVFDSQKLLAYFFGIVLICFVGA